jgi:type II secretory pathway pseudopilin PulG
MGRIFTLDTKTELSPGASRRPQTDNSQAGFTVLETAISLVLMAIVGLGAASLFFYAVRNISSAGDREMAMAVAQQSMEQLRNAAFSDSSLAQTSTSGTSINVTRGGRSYRILKTIVDSDVVGGAATAKIITVRVIPESDGSFVARTVSSTFGSVTLMSTRTTQSVGPNRAL